MNHNQAIEEMRSMASRHLQISPNENKRAQMIRNLIKCLEREIEGENDTKRLTVLRTEIEKLKEKLGEIE